MVRKAVISSLFYLLSHFNYAQITFVIESLPEATPGTDTVFICGTFNNWVPNDPKYALHRQLNGRLAVTLPASFRSFEYKFTRGSWTKVETNAENLYTQNRRFSATSENEVFIRIENWLDLGGARQLNYIIFYFFACAFQGIVLCLLAYRIHKKDPEKFKSFVVINLAIIILFILLVLHETLNQVWQGYIAFIFHIALFCWSPLVLILIHSFQKRQRVSGIYWHFTPAAVVLLFIVIRILNVDSFDFLSAVVWPPFALADLIVLTAGCMFNLVLFVKIYFDFSFLRLNRVNSGDHKTDLLRYYYWTSLIGLVLIPVNALVIASGLRATFIENYYAVAILFSVLIFLETYYLWRYPEIVKEEKTMVSPADNSSDWIVKLNNLMRTEKPYKNPDLSVSDLAEMLGTKPHILSKIINDSYHKNFRDFVNTYRVEEFIALANTKEFKHYTFLALAQEVGFNSKSTFNLVFKKVTNQSPREYFKSRIFS
jgi:AraC-like DNA-binding protein